MQGAARPPVNILLVDDRQDGIFAMEAVLKCPDYNLIVANSGEEALRYFLREDFAVVLLDVQMPGMDGFETARLMRRSEGSHKTPIIFVTAINFEDKYVNAGYESGAVDYIFKPFDPTILKSKVAVFADLYRMNQELLRQAELVRDIERKDRERLLAELELESLRRYQNLADAIPHIIWRARPDGTLDYFNKLWFDYTGLSLDQSTGIGWRSMIHDDDLQALHKAWIAVASSGGGYETECRIKRATDGEFRWHLVRAVPELDGGGRTVAWLVTCTDIHDRKLTEESKASLLALEQSARHEMEAAVIKSREAEAELIKAKEVAEEANRAKSQLLANMSHEIRTPLGIVLGLAELLLETHPSEQERDESMQTILRNGRQLSKLVDDILDISKIEAGRLGVEIIEFSLPELMSDISSTVGFHAGQKGLELSIDVKPNVPLRLKSDPMRLRQVLTNVIGNAVKFTEKGAVKVHVTAEDIKDEDAICVAFEVVDSGVGIAPESQQRLFQDFMQADSTTTRRFGGTGLGLALSRRLSRLLGGDLTLVRSAPGAGSSFKFWIKAARAGAKRMRDDVAVNKDTNRLDGLRVLLVEDAPDNQFLVSRMLQKVGAKIDLANDGKEGVDRALGGDYDVVLMDIQMPRMDGYEATSCLRDQGYRVPIIALTAHAMKEERERCLAKGFNDHLTKPIRQDDLLTQIHRQIAQRGKTAKRKPLISSQEATL